MTPKKLQRTQVFLATEFTEHTEVSYFRLMNADSQFEYKSRSDINRPPGLFEAFDKIRILQTTRLDEVNLPAEKPLEGIEQMEVIVKTIICNTIIELYDKVDVARWGKIALNRRAKDIQPADVVPSANIQQFILLFFNYRFHSIFLLQE